MQESLVPLYGWCKGHHKRGSTDILVLEDRIPLLSNKYIYTHIYDDIYMHKLRFHVGVHFHDYKPPNFTRMYDTNGRRKSRRNDQARATNKSLRVSRQLCIYVSMNQSFSERCELQMCKSSTNALHALMRSRKGCIIWRGVD